MKTSGIVAVAALMLQRQHVQATPVAQLVPRQKAGILLSLLQFFKDQFPDVKTTWDIGANKQMCKVYMETTDGANCKAYVECDDGKEYNSWNVCYVGGRQFFTDPRIGDFSIAFTQKDGISEGQGLTTPVLRLKYIKDWMELPVNALASRYQAHIDCERDGLGGSPFRDCDYGPYVCNLGSQDIITKRTKKYYCGVPKIGKGGGGLDSDAPVNERGYAPGWCGLHVIQYQKPNPAKDQYSLEVTAVNDNNEDRIGFFKKGGSTASVTSKLPLTIEIKTGKIDKDPVRFAYGDQSWDSNDARRCRVGKYDSGNRGMDCGFTCH